MKYVLFVCTQNAGRSQMAQALFERNPDEIRACADAILADYDDVPIRSFTMTLANRRARACLQEEICEPLATA